MGTYSLGLNFITARAIWIQPGTKTAKHYCYDLSHKTTRSISRSVPLLLLSNGTLAFNGCITSSIQSSPLAYLLNLRLVAFTLDCSYTFPKDANHSEQVLEIRIYVEEGLP